METLLQLFWCENKQRKSREGLTQSIESSLLFIYNHSRLNQRKISQSLSLQILLSYELLGHICRNISLAHAVLTAFVC